MKNIVLPALGAFAGTFVKNVVDEEPLEAAVGAAFNIIFQYLPEKYLGHKLNKGNSIHAWVLPSHEADLIEFTGYAFLLSITKEVIWISKEM